MRFQERPGALRLFQERLGTQLGDAPRLHRPHFLPGLGAQGQQPFLRRLVVEQAHQAEQHRPAHQSRYPESRPQPGLPAAESLDDEQHRRGGHQRPHALGRLQQPHPHAQVPPEPQRHRRRQRHLEQPHRGAENHPEEDIELPQVVHHPGKAHPQSEQQRPQGHRHPHAVAVAQPAGRRPQHPRHHPLQGEPEPDGAVAPAEELHQPGNQDAGRRAER